MGRKEKENTEMNENNQETQTTNNQTESTDQAVNENTQDQSSESSNNDAEQKIAELNDKYLRLYSDFDNFRKRTMKEKADLISTAGASVLKDLLVVLDDFERAIANNEKVEDVQTVREGFKLIQHKLVTILQSKGLEFTESKGEVFDADKHEAVTNIAVTDENQKGKVVDVLERGYNLHGKPLRFAKVVVGQ